MFIDLVLNPFGATVPAIIEAAQTAESADVDGLWVPDHFSGAVVGAGWSRDPFLVLGAIAATTDRVRVGPLVANVRNRSAPQLASAINSLSSIAPGRTVLGVGSGAAPGSRFAVEHDAIGTDLADAETRRSILIEHIHAVRALHQPSATCRCGIGEQADDGVGDRVGGGPAGDAAAIDDRLAVTDGSACPPVVVGASAHATVQAAVDHADGVNLRAGASVPVLVEAARRTAPSEFEISVLDDSQIDRGRIEQYRRLGIDRLVIGVELGAGSEPLAGLLGRLPLG